MKAHEKLKAIESAALSIAKGARDLIVSEGWEEELGGHRVFVRVASLLEARGKMRLKDIGKAMGYSDLRSTEGHVKRAIGAGLVRRVSRGVYEAVPRGERAPNAQMKPPARPKKRKYVKRDPLAALGKA